MKNIINIMRASVILSLLGLIAGCSGAGGSSNSGTSSTDQATGSIALKLAWSTTEKIAAKSVESAPAGVVTVRIIVTGSGISPDLRKDFSATAGSGTITGVPAGTERTVSAEALDASGKRRDRS